MKTKKDVKLYNMLFPMYLLWLIPITWIIVLPANFIIDSAVVVITLSALKLPRKSTYKKIILKVWGFGFLSDFIGSAFLFIVSLGSSTIAVSNTMFTETIRTAFNEFRLAVEYNPYSNVLALIVTVIGITISALCIYKFNLKNTLRNVNMGYAHKKRLSLMLAIFTAPYMLLIPAYLFF